MAELLTRAVHHALRGAPAQQFSLAFDFHGEKTWVQGDELALSCGLHRLLCAAIDLNPRRSLLVDGEVRPAITKRKVVATLRVAGSGVLWRDAPVDELLARLQLAETRADPNRDQPRLRRAHGICASTGAHIEFGYSPAVGFLLHYRLSLDAEEALHDIAEPNAGRARAWVVDADAQTGDSLERRLQRLGWATTSFASLAQAARRLRTMPAAHARPALVVAIEAASTSEGELLELSTLLPDQTGCLLLTRPGAASLSNAERFARVQVRAMPLSPCDLKELTAEYSAHAQAPTGFTRPAPLLEIDRPALLVVDDDEVNRVIAANMAESLGCRVRVACDGAEALEACRLAPPALVLMDVSMPGMDGIDATRRMRELQRNGHMAPFAVVASTTEVSPLTRQCCFDAGMDGFLSKPLLRAELLGELRRLIGDFVRPA